MKITKRQLRRIIREAMTPDIPDTMGAIGGGKFQPREEEFAEENWIPWLEDRSLSADDLDDLANYVGVPDRFALDAYPPANGKIGPADIEEWAEDQKAAREILSTRAGSYKGTTLPGGRWGGYYPG
mgnify:FL=1